MIDVQGFLDARKLRKPMIQVDGYALRLTWVEQKISCVLHETGALWAYRGRACSEDEALERVRGQ